jgi:hypothetical protein
MIDLWDVGRAALWILGLAIVLATWSYARWWAIKHGVRIRHTLKMPAFAVPFCAGLALLCLGLALSGHRWWETGAWAFLALVSAAQGTYTWVTRSRTAQTGATSGSQEGEAQ